MLLLRSCEGGGWVCADTGLCLFGLGGCLSACLHVGGCFALRGIENSCMGTGSRKGGSEKYQAYA